MPGLATVSPATLDVTVTLVARAFQHWDVRDRAWRTELGAFTAPGRAAGGDLPLSSSLVIEPVLE